MSSENDFDFYGEEAEEGKVQDIKGMTDEVTEFTYTGLQYPCIIFNSDVKFKNHQWRIIANMVKAVDSDKDTALYYRDDSGLVKMGMLSGRQIESFLELVGLESVTGYFSEKEELKGSILYTLCVM